MRVDIALFASSLTVLGPTVGGGVVTRIAEQPSSAPAAHATQAVPQDIWHHLLDAFVAHDSTGKQRIDATAQSADDSPVRALARRLQQEWQLPRGADALKRPSQVHVPTLLTRGPGSAESFVFNVTVAPDGRVAEATLVKPPRQRKLANEARANVLRALFRPAFNGRQFVDAHFVMRMTVEVQ
jgi:hypothetical protein